MSSTIPLREISLVALAAAAIYVLLAMVSYSPQDPAFTFSGDGGEIRNLVGASGAWFADLALYLFGVMAYLLPLALIVAGVNLLREREEHFSWLLFAVRSVGWTVLFICGCILSEIHFTAGADLPAGSGGIVGKWLAEIGVPVFGWVGLTLLSLTGVLIGAQAAAGFSWLNVAEFIGRMLHRAGEGIRRYVDRRLDIWRQRSNERSATKAVVSARKVARQQAKTAPEIPAAVESVAEPKIAKIIKPLGKPKQQKLFAVKTSGDLPALDLLDEPDLDRKPGFSAQSLKEMSELLEEKLADFGIEAKVERVLPGPVVTRFEIQPAAGIKVQRISALAKDLARSLTVISVRIVEVIPGKSAVGIEIPNKNREVVRLKEVLADPAFQNAKSPLALALGKDIMGESVVTEVDKMPHLLVAGTTGSGKSVGVNAMLLSILCKSTPEDVRLIMIDPKMLELSVYEGIPHLLTPVVTDMREAAMSLNWCVGEMERRYKLMAALGVRNLAGYNKQVLEAEKEGGIPDPLWNSDLDEPAPMLEKLPMIVVFIDEFADMMMIVGKKVEQLIARIAQKARAAGIHLVLATQRPSVDVITGLIKANIPTRISFQVSSKIDSRTILDQGGAEQLLGHGDMLYLPPGSGVPVRVHGAFVSDEEVHRVVSDWKTRGAPDYLEDVLTGGSDEPFVELESKGGGNSETEDALYDEAVGFVLDSRRASISSVQRKLRIGYNRAARLIEAMEEAGVVSEMGSNGSREVLVPKRD